MQVSAILLALGESGFRDLLRSVSIGKLKTYQLYEQLKARARAPKLNVETMRKISPRLWERVSQGENDLAADLAQAVLVSNLDMVIEVLNYLGVPNHDGFFEKNLDATEILTEGWQQRALDHFRSRYAEPLILFYLNHLAMEVTQAEEVFAPAKAQ
jgi:hypothetical protein